MLIFMSGVPHSGKSTFVALLKEYISSAVQVTHINPKDFLPEEYVQADDETRTQYNIAAWSVALEEFNNHLSRSDDELIILDTCGASYNSMAPLVNNGKIAGHAIIYINVDAPDELLAEFAGKDYVGDEIISHYRTTLSSTAPALRKKADAYFSIENGKNNVVNLQWQAREVAKYILSRLAQKLIGR